MTEKNLTAAESAELLIAHLKKGKEVHDIFAQQFRNRYTIAGRTIEDWEKYFKISVPANPDPQVCKSMDMQIMELHQEAAFYFAEASARAQALRKGSDTEYRSRYTALVAEYQKEGKKLPAHKSLEDLTKAETDNIESAVVNADIQKDFWKSIMEHLNMCRRLLENATINSGIEAKMALNYGGTIHDTRGTAETNSGTSW